MIQLLKRSVWILRTSGSGFVFTKPLLTGIKRIKNHKMTPAPSPQSRAQLVSGQPSQGWSPGRRPSLPTAPLKLPVSMTKEREQSTDPPRRQYNGVAAFSSAHFHGDKQHYTWQWHCSKLLHGAPLSLRSSRCHINYLNLMWIFSEGSLQGLTRSQKVWDLHSFG